ncbi:MAG: FtsW/RodA/SpoVE family cell cycle protein [Veillonellaceae bacterium]|jgi:cell division protein FtsW (lipid II flippase)|nr:FtsW/RodA/SpoVE family cell cycle protein [Veillonellaceae bacterium]
MAEARCEFKLLIIASLIGCLGILAVSTATLTLNITILIVAAGMLILPPIAFRLRNQANCITTDPLLLPLAIALTGLGLVIILRLKPNLFPLQATWAAIGLLCFVGSTKLFRNLEKIAQYKYLCGIIGIGLLFTAIIFGVDIGGNKNWVIIGPVRFQPSEFAKIFIVLFLAAYLAERHDLLALTTNRYGPLELPHPRFIAPLLAIWGLAMVMLVLQRDLGSALLFFGVTILMTYMASGRFSYVVLGLTLFLLGSIICYQLYPHVRVRVDIWLNPWSDPSGKAFQIVQSLFALGSGGVLGSGLTYGFPHLIPEVHTDFVFAAIGEELGLLGTAAVLLLYITLIYRSFKIALTCRKPFSTLVAAGLAIATGLQVFIIIGGVTKFFPLTGITLPFISYGGSSMIANFILLGILSAVSEMRAKNA